jgi:hypothetical protein
MTRSEAIAWIYNADEWDMRARGGAIEAAYNALIDAVMAARGEDDSADEDGQ